MNVMVERAARAIIEAIVENEMEDHSMYYMYSWPDRPENLERALTIASILASAAIKAMRKPTQAMRLAADDADEHLQDWDAIWGAMIDEALSDGGGGGGYG